MRVERGGARQLFPVRRVGSRVTIWAFIITIMIIIVIVKRTASSVKFIELHAVYTRCERALCECNARSCCECTRVHVTP